MKSLINSFKYAFNGIKYCWYNELSFRIHTVIAGWAVVMSIILNISYIEWVAVLSAIIFVLVCEMLNTSFEALNDLTHKKKNGYSKISKDVAAGAVLASVMYSIVIGCIIFIPKIIMIIQGT